MNSKALNITSPVYLKSRYVLLLHYITVLKNNWWIYCESPENDQTEITVWSISVDLIYLHQFIYNIAPSKHSLLIYSGPLSARQGSWRADNGPL